MARDKNPSLPKTCLICRNKIIGQIKIRPDSSFTAEQDGSVSEWRALCVESFCMLYGIPQNHPFASIFRKNGKQNGQTCNQCFEDVSNVHLVFWQLQKLEKRLTVLQQKLFGKLRLNYDAMPVATVFATKTEDDIKENLPNLLYDDIVKILFERIKDTRDVWPRPFYSSRWKEACNNARNQQSEPEVPFPVGVVKTEVDVSSINPAGEDSSTFFSTERDTVCAIDDEQDDDLCGSPEPLSPMGSPSFSEPLPGTSRISHKRKRRPGPQMKKVVTTKKPDPSSKKTEMRYLCIEDPEVCNRTYSAKKHLLTHIRSHHKGVQFICSIDDCSKRFTSSAKLQSHKEKTHEKKRTTEICETCGIELPRMELKKHFYLRHLGVGKFSCDICSMDFNDPDQLKIHEQLHQEAEFPFICVVCQNLFTNSMDLKFHVNRNHLSSGLKCSICGIMKHNDYLLQRHMKLHERTNRFVCHCGKSFASKAYLTYHQEHFHDNVGKKYPCEVCGKSFLHMKNVLRHMITHKEEKPYQCKICSKQFNYSHLLKKHEEIHSGTKNYGCEVCGKRFRQEQNLTQHMRSHRPKPEKNAKKQVSKPKESKVINSNSNDDEVNESVPVIVGVKGESREIKPEIGKMIITAEAVPEHQSDHSAATQGPSLVSQNVVPQQGTATTVVFVTADPNFHWIN